MQSSAKIFSGTGSQYLAERIAQKYGIPLGKITISKEDPKTVIMAQPIRFTKENIDTYDFGI